MENEGRGGQDGCDLLGIMAMSVSLSDPSHPATYTLSPQNQNQAAPSLSSQALMMDDYSLYGERVKKIKYHIRFVVLMVFFSGYYLFVLWQRSYRNQKVQHPHETTPTSDSTPDNITENLHHPPPYQYHGFRKSNDYGVGDEDEDSSQDQSQSQSPLSWFLSSLSMKVRIIMSFSYSPLRFFFWSPHNKTSNEMKFDTFVCCLCVAKMD